MQKLSKNYPKIHQKLSKNIPKNYQNTKVSEESFKD